MRRASEILFLIGMILSIVVAVCWFICGISAIVVGSVPAIKEALIQALNELKEQAGSSAASANVETLASLIQGGIIGSGVAFLFLGGFSVANAVFSAKAKAGKPTRTIAILNIVFGILSDVIVNVVGAVLSLIQDGRDERRKAKAIENQAE